MRARRPVRTTPDALGLVCTAPPMDLVPGACTHFNCCTAHPPDLPRARATGTGGVGPGGAARRRGCGAVCRRRRRAASDSLYCRGSLARIARSRATGARRVDDGGLSSTGRAADCGSAGYGFDPHRPPHLSWPAQSSANLPVRRCTARRYGLCCGGQVAYFRPGVLPNAQLSWPLPVVAPSQPGRGLFLSRDSGPYRPGPCQACVT